VTARAAAGWPSGDLRRLLDIVSDVAVAAPILARSLAESVLPPLLPLARLAEDAEAADLGEWTPLCGKVLGAFASVLPEVRAPARSARLLWFARGVACGGLSPGSQALTPAQGPAHLPACQLPHATKVPAEQCAMQRGAMFTVTLGRQCDGLSTQGDSPTLPPPTIPGHPVPAGK